MVATTSTAVFLQLTTAINTPPPAASPLVVALDDGHTIASYPSTDGGGMRRYNGQLLYIEERYDSPEKGQLFALQDVAAAWA